MKLLKAFFFIDLAIVTTCLAYGVNIADWFTLVGWQKGKRVVVIISTQLAIWYRLFQIVKVLNLKFIPYILVTVVLNIKVIKLWLVI